MKLHAIETGNFKLDGGAMFGAVPKMMWSKIYPADEMNLCNLSLRCLLVETEGKKIIIDTGIGAKQDAKFFSYYFLNGEETLSDSLKKAGIQETDITDVVITHFHFDHAGGCVKKNEITGELEPTFPNATYHASRKQWNNAMSPNLRERPSMLRENFIPLETCNCLNLFDSEYQLTKNITLRQFFGHTDGLVVPFIQTPKGTVVYCSDLIPTSAHVPVSWYPAYDVQPLVVMQEKEEFLEEVVKNNYILFFEHDLYTEACTVEKDKGKFKIAKKMKINEL